MTVRCSIVIPVLDEADSIALLCREIGEAMAGFEYEIIFVDDGSRDATAERIAEQTAAGAPIRTVTHPERLGQSAALVSGVCAAEADVILTIDGDGQNDPADLPAILTVLDGADAAVGVRTRRRDTWWRRFGSRVAHRVRNLVLGDGIVDVGCATRAFRRADFFDLPQFDGMHRLLPALLVLHGRRVVEIPVHHRPRHAGTSKYGNVARGWRGLFDLIGLAWLKRRQLRRPPRSQGARSKGEREVSI